MRCGQLRKLHVKAISFRRGFTSSCGSRAAKTTISARVSTKDNCKVAVLFTIVSLIRSYCLRRLFNWVHVYKALRAPHTQMVAVGGERRDLGG